MSLKEEFLEYPDGVKIRLLINEHNNRRIALFIHGFGERLEYYDYLYSYFETNDIALNMVGLRGHGGSGGKRVVHDITDYLKDIKRVIFGNLSNSEIILIGSGVGSLLALRAAEDSRLHIKSLVLISPPLKLNITPTREILYVLLSTVINNFKARIIDDYWKNQTDDADLAAAITQDESARKSFVTAGFISMIHRELKNIFRQSARLREIPTLAVLNEDDLFLDPAGCESILKNIFQGSDHLKIAHTKKGGSVLLTKSRVDHLDRIITWIKNSSH